MTWEVIVSSDSATWVSSRNFCYGAVTGGGQGEGKWLLTVII